MQLDEPEHSSSEAEAYAAFCRLSAHVLKFLFCFVFFITLLSFSSSSYAQTNGPGCPTPESGNSSSGSNSDSADSSSDETSGGSSEESSEGSSDGSGGTEEPTPQTDDNNQNCRATCPGCCKCHAPIINNHKAIRGHVTVEFQKYRDWLVNMWWKETMMPALMVMTSQMTAASQQQVMMIGTMFDAKHQLETQRLFQQMTALAHKDYHPSEGLCVFGTNIKNLAASERLTAAAHVGLAERFQQRQLMTGENMAQLGKESDKLTRLEYYRKVYCNKEDNGRGLEKFCASGGTKRPNKDIDFTTTVENALTLNLDLSDRRTATTEDEEDILALSANLFGHDIIPYYHPSIYAGPDGQPRDDALPVYMKARSIIARRAVAQDSFAALTAMRAKGEPDSIPFLRTILKELGLEETEIDKFIGEDPSYMAQMEVLTKEIFKNPNFYVDLYDKPANVERKAAVLDALMLMQDRDIYKSLLRSEASLAILLENSLHREQQRVSSQIQRVIAGGKEVDE